MNDNIDKLHICLVRYPKERYRHDHCYPVPVGFSELTIAELQTLINRILHENLNRDFWFHTSKHKYRVIILDPEVDDILVPKYRVPPPPKIKWKHKITRYCHATVKAKRKALAQGMIVHHDLSNKQAK